MWWASVMLVLTTLVGCASKAPRPREGVLSEQHLDARLHEFANFFSAAIQRAGDKVNEVLASREARRDMLRWQMFMIPACRQAVNQDDVLDAFIDAWTLCVQQENFFESRVPRLDTPEAQETHRVTRETATQLVAEIEALGASFLSDAIMEEARADVEAFAAANPIDSRYARFARLPSDVEGASGGAFDWVDSIPLIGAFSGLDEGARAVAKLADAADDFARTFEALPEVAGWQTSLLLYELDELESVRVMETTAARLGDNADRLVDLVDALPARAEEVVRSSIEGVVSSSQELRETIAAGRATVTALDGALVNADQLVASLDTTARSVALAGDAWTATIRSLDELAATTGGPDPEADTTSDFDLAELGAVAENFTRTAVEVRALVQEVRDLARSDDLDRPLDGADTRARSVVDHATVRLLQLVGAVLIAACLYRGATRFLPRA